MYNRFTYSDLRNNYSLKHLLRQIQYRRHLNCCLGSLKIIFERSTCRIRVLNEIVSLQHRIRLFTFNWTHNSIKLYDSLISEEKNFNFFIQIIYFIIKVHLSQYTVLQLIHRIQGNWIISSTFYILTWVKIL